MVYAPRRHRYAAVLALSFACDTGYDVRTTVIVTEEVAAAYSPLNPGVLIIDLRAEGGDGATSRQPVAVICGEARSYTVGGGGDGEFPDRVVVNAWIEPVTSGSCTQSAQALLGEEPPYADDDEPQARAVVEGAGGCDHEGSVELTLALP